MAKHKPGKYISKGIVGHSKKTGPAHMEDQVNSVVAKSKLICLGEITPAEAELRNRQHRTKK